VHCPRVRLNIYYKESQPVAQVEATFSMDVMNEIRLLQGQKLQYFHLEMLERHCLIARKELTFLSPRIKHFDPRILLFGTFLICAIFIGGSIVFTLTLQRRIKNFYQRILLHLELRIFRTNICCADVDR
jgi:hypothetical protein